MKHNQIAAFVVLAASAVVLAWAIWLHYSNRDGES